MNLSNTELTIFIMKYKIEYFKGHVIVGHKLNSKINLEELMNALYSR